MGLVSAILKFYFFNLFTVNVSNFVNLILFETFFEILFDKLFKIYLI